LVKPGTGFGIIAFVPKMVGPLRSRVKPGKFFLNQKLIYPELVLNFQDWLFGGFNPV